MKSYVSDIGAKERASGRFISHVCDEIRRAFVEEKEASNITQQQIAASIGVNRSVINRQLRGIDNMTLRSIAEILWAMGWKPNFKAIKPEAEEGTNDLYTSSAGVRITVPPNSDVVAVEEGQQSHTSDDVTITRFREVA